MGPVVQSAVDSEPHAAPTQGGDAGRAGPGFRSTFAPPDAKPHGTGRYRCGHKVTARDFGRLFVLVMADGRGLMGMRGDLQGDGFGVCKIASIAYIRYDEPPSSRGSSLAESGLARCKVVYSATGVMNPGRPSGPVGPPTRTIRIPAAHYHPGALSSGDRRHSSPRGVSEATLSSGPWPS